MATVEHDAEMPVPPDSDAQGIDVPGLGRALLELHRAGREAPYDAFQPRALEAIRSVVAFDSAWWGNASAEPTEIHRLHLHACAPGIVDDYPPHMARDFFREALMANPGTTINMADLTTRARYVRSVLYRELGRRHRIEWSLGTLVVEPVSSLNEFLTLWRHDPRRPFDEKDRRTKEILMPHVVEAHRHARLRAVLGGSEARQDPWAVADARGYLREVSPGFVHALRDRWPAWQGSRLPEDLLAAVGEAPPLAVRGLRLEVVPRGEFRYLEVARESALDRLTAREREIATRYARGQTYHAIAAELGLAPATVRNHIARCYRKLAVNNKAELVLRVLPRGGER